MESIEEKKDEEMRRLGNNHHNDHSMSQDPRSLPFDQVLPYGDGPHFHMQNPDTFHANMQMLMNGGIPNTHLPRSLYPMFPESMMNQVMDARRVTGTFLAVPHSSPSPHQTNGNAGGSSSNAGDLMSGGSSPMDQSDESSTSPQRNGETSPRHLHSPEKTTPTPHFNIKQESRTALNDSIEPDELNDTEETMGEPLDMLNPNTDGKSGKYTYEEQFKQLYEIDSDPERAKFLNEVFAFMEKKGATINRVPIMAKSVLDLYLLFKLVTERGGLVEVINKKIWREITKGLNLPNSITSAAFTLRTQYMRYLYEYECEKFNYSTRKELNAAIEGNKREGRKNHHQSEPGSPGTQLPLYQQSPHIQSHLHTPQPHSYAPFINPYSTLMTTQMGRPFRFFPPTRTPEAVPQGSDEDAELRRNYESRTRPLAAEDGPLNLHVSSKQSTPIYNTEDEEEDDETEDERPVELTSRISLTPQEPKRRKLDIDSPKESDNPMPRIHLNIEGGNPRQAIQMSITIGGVLYQGLLKAAPGV